MSDRPFMGCITPLCTSEVVPNTSKCAVHTVELVTAYDPVTRPKHYNSHPSGIECITIAQHHNFNVGNTLKYLWRCGLKDGEDVTEALRKAAAYVAFEIERVRKLRG